MLTVEIATELANKIGWLRDAVKGQPYQDCGARASSLTCSGSSLVTRSSRLCTFSAPWFVDVVIAAMAAAASPRPEEAGIVLDMIG